MKRRVVPDNVCATIALFGNPNSGKTTLFNQLTGQHFRVGNWPGVTVERKEGYYRTRDETSCIRVIDLPGCYEIHSDENALAEDERIAYQYLTQTANRAGHLIVNLVDASHLARHLYLTTQLIEMQIPCMVIVSMVDIAEKKGIHIDFKQLSLALGCPVIARGRCKGMHRKALKTGIEHIARQATDARAAQRPIERLFVGQPDLLCDAYRTLKEYAARRERPSSLAQQDLPIDWVALRLLEGDRAMLQSMPKVLQQKIKDALTDIEQFCGEEAAVLLADARYRWIQDTLAQVQHKDAEQVVRNIDANAFWDRIILNRWVAMPLFLVVLYTMFWFSVKITGGLQTVFDTWGSRIFVQSIAMFLKNNHAPTWLLALLADGLGRGISTVFSLLPVVGGMFLFLSCIEETGYINRVAFLMDRFMRFLRLPGKAFIPLIIGFGCNVPAILSTRTLEHAHDRVLTVLMTPFMSCSARLTVYTIFCSAFFPKQGHRVVFALYLIGVGMAVLTGLLLRHTFLSAEQSALVMELPAYRRPHMRQVVRHVCRKLRDFILRTGRLLIPVCMVMALCNTISVQHQGKSIPLLDQAGRLITPIFAPMGIHADNWPASVSLLSGVLAKEVVIGSLNTLYRVQQSSERQQNVMPENKKILGYIVHQFKNSHAAFAYLLFLLLYVPCLSTVSVISKEIGRHWAIFSLTWSTALAYTTATFYYQCVTFALHPRASLMWIVMVFSVLSLVWLLYRWLYKKYPSGLS